MLQITEGQRQELDRWVHSQALGAGDIFRARLILALAEGRSYSEIMSALRTTAPTIARWKSRFEQCGIEGLSGRHRGRAGVGSAAVQAKIESIRADQPLSYRKLAAELLLSKSTIQRICAQNHTKPHRLDSYLARPDRFPEDRPGNDIVGLYLHSPQHAAAFSVDEFLPSTRGSLYAALEAGFSSSRLNPHHTVRQFNQFRNLIVDTSKAQIHLILDNAHAHSTLDIELFLATNPHTYLHFVPSYRQWVEHVDFWFSRTQVNYGADVGAIVGLRKYLAAYAKSSVPFRWVYGL